MLFFTFFHTAILLFKCRLDETFRDYDFANSLGIKMSKSKISKIRHRLGARTMTSVRFLIRTKAIEAFEDERLGKKGRFRTKM